jgi:DNA helicase HerA-like ATPase
VRARGTGSSGLISGKGDAMGDPSQWQSIGTIVGDASTAEFTFILRSFKSRLGDIVAVPMEVPNQNYTGVHEIIAWGRVTAIERYNPFFPYEAAQELASQGVPLVDTVLSSSRDQLQAKVLVLGYTAAQTGTYLDLYPLTYPIPPAAEVRYPAAEAVQNLLTGGVTSRTPVRIGTLIARTDVRVDISAERIASRHLAIMAMTGGGKTVAARRVLREFINLGYPILIFDPHGDYLGLWEKRNLFPNNTIRLFFPHIVMTNENRRVVETLIAKMTEGLTEPQQELMSWLLANVDPEEGQPVLEYLQRLIQVVDKVRAKRESGDSTDILKVGAATARVVRRSLQIVEDRLRRMEQSNVRLRAILREYDFDALPDPEGRPESIVRPNQVSILYLGGYDHLTQSTIVSLLMEALFEHRAQLADRIAPLLTVVEEAHNFVPSGREGTEDTPSLVTLRKVITEGRKFGVGLVLITQRPNRVDETILAQCNSFLVMRLVNPRDQSYVRSVMENLPESDARMLPGFGPGQGIISGQAVRFPLLVKIDFDEDLVGTRTGDEDFIKRAAEWQPDSGAGSRARAAAVAASLMEKSGGSGTGRTRRIR